MFDWKRNDQKQTVHRAFGCLTDEKGVSTVEWISMVVVGLLLLLSVGVVMSAVGGQQIGQSVTDVTSTLVESVGQGAPAVEAPNLDIQPLQIDTPQIEGPQIQAPTIVGPSVAVPQITVDLFGQNQGGESSGGGFWGWVGDRLDDAGSALSGAGGWISDRFSDFQNAFSELPSWAKGLIIGIAAGIAIVVVAVAAVAAGIVASVSAIALVAAVVVAGIVGLIYGIVSGDNFNGWHAFGLSLLGGVVALIAVEVGAIAAAWTWLRHGAWPAVARVGQAIATRTVGAVRAAGQWLTRTAWPAIVNGGRAIAARVTGTVRAIGQWITQTAWPRLAALGTRLRTGIAAMLRNGWKAVSAAFKAKFKVLIGSYTAYFLKLILVDFLMNNDLSLSNWHNYLFDLTIITVGVLWVPAAVTKAGKWALAGWAAAFSGVTSIIKEIKNKGFNPLNWDWGGIGISAVISGIFKNISIGKTAGEGIAAFVKRVVTTSIKEGINRIVDWIFPSSGPAPPPGGTTPPTAGSGTGPSVTLQPPQINPPSITPPQIQTPQIDLPTVTPPTISSPAISSPTIEPPQIDPKPITPPKP
ncbi:MAG: hypothetical protein QNJ45_14570 [Ardenticatenaceae bacterium]|nr:hypothetical protein [Ardenticatenaceae bacterium]